MLLLLWVALATATQNTDDQKAAELRPRITENEKEVVAKWFAAKRANESPYLKNEANLYDLLRLRPIRQELEISEQTADKIFANKSRCEKAILERYNSTRGQGGQQAFAAYQLELQMRAELLVSTRALLSEPQRLRLAQLGFYSEIELLGLDAALAEGVFGKEVGVHENQISHLRAVVRRLIADEQVQVRKLHLELHKEVLSILNMEERKVVDTLLGPYFDFNLGNWKVVRDTRGYLAQIIPGNVSERGRDAQVLQEANSRNLRVEWKSTLSQKYQLIRNKQIQTALGLSDEQIQVIDKNAPLTVDVASDKAFLSEAEQRFDEIIEPSQQLRLEQIFQYLEIASYGYAHYFTKGDFLKRSGMSSARRDELRDRISALEMETDRKLKALKQKTYDFAFEQLTAEQQNAAHEALGEFFYAPHHLFAHLRDSVDYSDPPRK